MEPLCESFVVGLISDRRDHDTAVLETLPMISLVLIQEASS